MQIDPLVHLRANSCGTAREEMGLETLWEDHQQQAEHLEVTSGSLRLCGAWWCLALPMIREDRYTPPVGTSFTKFV